MTTVFHLKQINTLFHFSVGDLKEEGRLHLTLLSACFSRHRSLIAHTVAGTTLKYWAVYRERAMKTATASQANTARPLWTHTASGVVLIQAEHLVAPLFN